MVGNIIKSIDDEGRTIDVVYDKLDRQTCVIRDPEGKNIREEYTYDFAGNTLSVKDGEGYIIQYEYDLLGRLVKASNHMEDGRTISTNYEFDIKDGNYVKNKMIDPMNRVKITMFDALGRVVAEINEGDPDSEEYIKTEYNYDNFMDEGKNIKKVTGYSSTDDEDNDITYIYESLGRLSRLEHDEYNYTRYKYDANGNRISMTDVYNDETIETIYAYDSMDRLTQMVQDGHSITYSYDKSDNITKVSYPIEGEGIRDVEYINYYLQFYTRGSNYTRISFSYDRVGLPTKISYLDNATERKEEYKITVKDSMILNY